MTFAIYRPKPGSNADDTSSRKEAQAFVSEPLTDPNMRKAIQAWLDAQCSALQGVSDAVLMLVPRGGQVRLAVAAAWPRGVTVATELQAAAVEAFDRRVPAINPLNRPNAQHRSIVAHPVQVRGRTVGAVAICVPALAKSAMQSVMAMVAGGAANFEPFLRRSRDQNTPPSGDAFFKTGTFVSPNAATSRSAAANSLSTVAPAGANRRTSALDKHAAQLNDSASGQEKVLRAPQRRAGRVPRWNGRSKPWLARLSPVGLGSASLLVFLVVSISPLTGLPPYSLEQARPIVLTVLLFCIGLLSFHLYLRRVLGEADLSAALPERVRGIFDALSEGVLVVDRQGVVLHVNRACRQMQPHTNVELTGKRIADIEWISSSAGADPNRHPWALAMERGEAVTGAFLQISNEAGEQVTVSINCFPIRDRRERVRECLITLDDLSTVEHMNKVLLDLVSRLDAANDTIQKHNEELNHLARHDPLTGTLTRRAFMEQAERIFVKSAGQCGHVACVMVDIDHVKSINDRYGHLVGDQAIRQVADVLSRSVRAGDLVSRLGGAQFCVLLPRATAQDAMEVAERMRTTIEATCGRHVIPGERVQLTSSLGVSSISGGSITLPELMNQADLALFAAKGTGRNRVVHSNLSLASPVAPRVVARGAAGEYAAPH